MSPSSASAGQFFNALLIIGIVVSQALLAAIIGTGEFLWLEHGALTAMAYLILGTLVAMGYFALLTRLRPGQAGERFRGGIALALIIAGCWYLSHWSGERWRPYLETRFIRPTAVRVFGSEAGAYLTRFHPRSVASEWRPATVEYESGGYPKDFNDKPCCVQQGDGVFSIDEVLFPEKGVAPLKEIAVHAPSHNPFWVGDHNLISASKRCDLVATIEAPGGLPNILVVRGRLKLPIYYAENNADGTYDNVAGKTNDVWDLVLLPRQYAVRDVDQFFSAVQLSRIFHGVLLGVCTVVPFIVLLIALANNPPSSRQRRPNIKSEPTISRE
jgi:hypothetical protein